MRSLEKSKMKANRKQRWEKVKKEDRNELCRVHNGKEYVKRTRGNPRSVGIRWGERVKTRKPCITGANRMLRKTKKVKT